MAESELTTQSGAGKWLVAAAFLGVACAILPLSWFTIQAELAQSSNMKALSKTLTALETALKRRNCDLFPLKLEEFRQSVMQINTSFPKLAGQRGSFLSRSRDLLVVSDSLVGLDCASLRPAVKQVRSACDACHQEFRLNGPVKSRPE